MKIEFATDIRLRDRLLLLWYGRLYISAEYKGQHVPLDVRFAVMNPKDDKTYGEKEDVNENSC